MSSSADDGQDGVRGLLEQVEWEAVEGDDGVVGAVDAERGTVEGLTT